MSILSKLLTDLKPTVTDIITAELTTNPQLSEAQATVAVMRNVDHLLDRLGSLGKLAEQFVNLYINLEVPAIYTKLVQDALGTTAGTGIVAAQAPDGPA